MRPDDHCSRVIGLLGDGLVDVGSLRAQREVVGLPGGNPRDRIRQHDRLRSGLPIGPTDLFCAFYLG